MSTLPYEVFGSTYEDETKLSYRHLSENPFFFKQRLRNIIYFDSFVLCLLALTFFVTSTTVTMHTTCLSLNHEQPIVWQACHFTSVTVQVFACRCIENTQSQPTFYPHFPCFHCHIFSYLITCFFSNIRYYLR